MVGVVNQLYNKIVDYVYKYANQDPRGQQHQQWLLKILIDLYLFYSSRIFFNLYLYIIIQFLI